MIARLTASAIVALCVLVLAGCGESDSRRPAQSPATTPTPSAATTTATTETGPTDSEQAGEADAQAPAAPVDLRLKNGRFAASTPRRVHVPAGFPLAVSVRADSAGPYTVDVVPARGAKALVVKAGASAEETLPPLKAGQSVTLVVGSDSVTVVADAEPGP